MNRDKFNARLKDSSRPLIVDLWAPWCMPCRVMLPVLEQVSRKYQGKVTVMRINADESPDLVKSLHVFGIPTILGYYQGKEIVRRTGAQSAEALDRIFAAVMSGEKPQAAPVAPMQRILRAGGGLLVMALGWLLWHSFWLVGLGAGLMFSAVYDRCPIYRAVSTRIAGLFKRQPDSE